MKNVVAIAVCFLGLASVSQAGTVFVGYKDTAGPAVDYDYNDLVFSLTSNTLQLSAFGFWEFKPSLNPDPYNAANAGLQGTPFWNNTSSDGAKEGIGWCIYGGGNCNAGVGLDPTAEYLTSDPNSPFGSVNNVTFSSSGDVGASITLKISDDNSLVGWYNLSDPSTVYWLNSVDKPLVTTTFDPAGQFGLVVSNVTSGNTFYSQTSAGGTQDQVSHFAFFADQSGLPQVNAVITPTPEPASGLLGLIPVALLGWKLRRNKRA